jgi:hypothetical protein
MTFTMHGKPADEVWLIIFSFGAVLSFFIWLSCLRKLRTIRDTPTSKIVSAAQGYVELIGIGKPSSQPLVSKLRQAPCIWYSYLIEKKSITYETDEKGNIQKKESWEIVDQGASKESFILDDGTGECIIDLTGADIGSTNSTQWIQADFKYSESILVQNDPLFALGEFLTFGEVNTTVGDQSNKREGNYLVASTSNQPFIVRNTSCQDELIRSYARKSTWSLVIFFLMVFMGWFMFNRIVSY